MMIQKFTFDVMSDDGRFICTMRMPLGLGSIIDYEGDKPVISMAAVKRYVLEKRPSLSRRKWHIEF